VADRRSVLLAAATACAPVLRAAPVVRLLVAYPPGGVSDSVARMLARRLAPLIDRSIIVENRPGAGGSVAMFEVARSAPDGNVLCFCAISPLALSPLFGQAPPFVAPVSAIMHTPLLLLGTPGLSARSFAGMVDEARNTPGGLRWATSGVGTIGHLALEQVKLQFTLPLVHVPYAGGGQQLRDALVGHFEVLSSNLAPLQIDYVSAGRLTALAVGAPTRAEQLPSVPTFAELGAPAANLASLFGLFAPQATPPSIIEQWNAACAQVLADPEFRQILVDGGSMPAPGTPADFAREIARQSHINARLVQAMRSR
jgi:tripartite-type tricarboxylate transporter receptor subunit TctC